MTLNNSMALGVFLAIVHFRKLRWTFDSEVSNAEGFVSSGQILKFVLVPDT